MANSFKHKDTNINIGDTISIDYIIKEGDKERHQLFNGILIKIRGDDPENKMMTVRKMTKSGIGVERVIPLLSPYIASIKVTKKGNVRRSKLYFIRNLSDQELRRKLYSHK